MNAPFTQENRRARLTTSIGKDELVLLRMNGSEELSGDFEWRVEALSAQHALDLNKLLGTHATITMETRDGKRYFDGIVAEANRQGAEENGNRYNMVLRPWFYVAGLRRNQRIFHNLTVSQILSKLFEDYSSMGEPHFEMRLTADYPVLEYTVQYNESDAAFASRMMERFGITWHWIHTAGNHKLVLTDEVTNHADVPGGKRPFFGVDKNHQADHEHFREWFGGARMTTGAVRLTEYNFKIPNAAQEVDRSAEAAYDNSQIESFDWPGDYLTQDVGKKVVSRRIDSEEGQGLRVRAKGDVANLGSGLCVTLSGDKLPEATGKRFLCLKATHHLRTQAYGTTMDDSEERDYDGDYVLMPDTEPFRPERRTRRPVIHGPQTARVVGEGEIDCDEYGRILVRFHWDLHNQYSMRCRVSQNWASDRWGGMVIPRINMEVVVEFLEGDPDKPMVTGCVYNGKNMPPYELPKHKTRSTFKTDTHQGKGFNELRFEDERGKEEIFIHAQKDRNEKTLNNHTERVDNNWVQSVGHDKVIEVDGNHNETVLGNMQIHVGPSGAGRVLSSTFRRLVEGIGGVGAKLRVPGISRFGKGILAFFADNSVHIATPGMMTEHIGITRSIGVGRNMNIETGHALQMTSGAVAMLNAGDSVAISGGEDVHVTCGESRILLSRDGYIRLSGKTLYLNFENGVEVDGGPAIQMNADRIDLN